MIPAFDPKTGYLPAGVHVATWVEVVSYFGGNPHRAGQLNGLLAALGNLSAAGCNTVLLDGSFVTAKQFPDDYDAAWDTAGVNVGMVDPVLLDLAFPRLAMKTKYLGELFPESFATASIGSFREFFQQDRNGLFKGIVHLNLKSLP